MSEDTESTELASELAMEQMEFDEAILVDLLRLTNKVIWED
jgi:hypothetical protein